LTTYFVRRLIGSIPVLLLTSVVIYSLVAAQPGDPIDAYRADPLFTIEDEARLRQAYSLDRPIILRYLVWMGQALRGEFGYSQTYGEPVFRYVFEIAMPRTLLLSGTALIFALVISIPVGIFSASRQYSIPDYIVSFLTFLGFSTPVFWLGIMLIYLFAVALGGLLPAGGFASPWVTVEFDGWWAYVADRLRHLILPAFTLGALNMALWTRFMRASMLEVISQDYIRTARSKGLAERVVIFKHAFRNAVLPIVTLLGLAIPGVLSGAIITERVFAWPGMGSAIIASLVNKDYNVVMVALGFLAIIVIVANLLVDVVYALVDPRIRYG
jgi:peptide/nickel transport system permease protein